MNWQVYSYYISSITPIMVGEEVILLHFLVKGPQKLHDETQPFCVNRIKKKVKKQTTASNS